MSDQPTTQQSAPTPPPREELQILRQMFADEKYARRVARRAEPEFFFHPASRFLYWLFRDCWTTYGTLPDFNVVDMRLLKSLTPKLLKRFETSPEAVSQAFTEIKATTPSPDSAVLYKPTEEYLKRGLKWYRTYKEEEAWQQTQTNVTFPELDDKLRQSWFDVSDAWDALQDDEGLQEKVRQLNLAGIRLNIAKLDEWGCGRADRGGLLPKTLNVVFALSGKGKTMFLVHAAAEALRQKKNVCYVNLEVGDEHVSLRLRANLTDTPINTLKDMILGNFKGFTQKMDAARQGLGQFRMFTRPAHSITAADIRAMVEDLALSHNFTTDLLIVDYMTLLSTQRVNTKREVNTNQLYTSVAEDLRAVAQALAIPVLSAAQLNRDAYERDEHPTPKQIGKAIGIMESIDFGFSLMRTDADDKNGRATFAPLKVRLNDDNNGNVEPVYFDRSKAKFRDIPASERATSSPDGESTNASTFRPSPLPKGVGARRSPLASVRAVTRTGDAEDLSQYMKPVRE